MRSSVIIKLSILAGSLLLVIWASVAVREGSMEGFFASFTGGDPSKQINLCPNRIHSFHFSDTKKITELSGENGMQWLAIDPNPRPLNYLALEKWLGEHCFVNAQELNQDMSKLGAFKPIVKLEYIDKLQLSLMQSSANPNVYSWNGKLYESSDMTSALAELRQIAGW